MRRVITTLAALAITVGVLSAPTPASAAGAPCLVPGPGSIYCAGAVTFSSYHLSTPYRPFQGFAGTSAQPTIVISFSNPYVRAVRVWANDPDFPSSRAEVHLYSCCWIPFASFSGDGQPGVFSVSTAGVQNGPYTHVRLSSPSNDYVNWHVEYQRTINPGGQWCKVNAQSSTCDGVSWSISPFAQGSGFDPFQAAPGTGAQGPIDVTFGFPVLTVAATAVDPDFIGSRMETYASDGTLLGSVNFDHDSAPAWTSTSTKSISDSRGIKRIRLIAAPNDYVAFQGITIWPF